MKEEHFNISEAKAKFAQLIRRAEQGINVIIDRRNKPVVRLTSYRETGGERELGTGRDFVGKIPDDFNAPLPDDVLDSFYR